MTRRLIEALARQYDARPANERATARRALLEMRRRSAANAAAATALAELITQVLNHTEGETQ